MTNSAHLDIPNQPPHAILPDIVPIPLIASVVRASAFNYYGPVEPLKSSEVARYLADATDAVATEVEPIIESFLRAAYEDCVGKPEEKHACWLTIRVTEPSDAFKVPRWHQDGRMFSYDQGREDVVRSKYALTLLGPTTLMLQPNEQTWSTHQTGEHGHLWWRKTHSRRPTDDEMDEAHAELRQWLADHFASAERVQVGDGEIVRFSWGRPDSPTHSEPDLISERVFMTVLYGSEAELRRLCDWRRAEYGTSTHE